MAEQQLGANPSDGINEAWQNTMCALRDVTLTMISVSEETARQLGDPGTFWATHVEIMRSLDRETVDAILTKTEGEIAARRNATQRHFERKVLPALRRRMWGQAVLASLGLRKYSMLTQHDDIMRDYFERMRQPSS